jgi:hypothetical protein
MLRACRSSYIQTFQVSGLMHAHPSMLPSSITHIAVATSACSSDRGSLANCRAQARSLQNKQNPATVIDAARLVHRQERYEDACEASLLAACPGVSVESWLSHNVKKVVPRFSGRMRVVASAAMVHGLRLA